MRGPARDRLTVLIVCFHPARAGYLDGQVRHALRCRFVERVVVVSHNPELRPEGWIRVRDPRLDLRTETTVQGCGHRWRVAEELAADFLVVIDDDILLSAPQLARLFLELVQMPLVPHGLSGMTRAGDGFAFADRQDRVVDYLCEVYAVSRRHVEAYGALSRSGTIPAALRPLVESSHDFVVISSAGTGRPRIHDVGRILRHETFKTPGIAVHAQPDFFQSVGRLADALAPAVRPS